VRNSYAARILCGGGGGGCSSDSQMTIICSSNAVGAVHETKYRGVVFGTLLLASGPGKVLLVALVVEQK
jgi:hypothetical protein